MYEPDSSDALPFTAAESSVGYNAVVCDDTSFKYKSSGCVVN